MEQRGREWDNWDPLVEKRSIASNLPPSSERWISVAHEVIARSYHRGQVPGVSYSGSEKTQTQSLVNSGSLRQALRLSKRLREEETTSRKARKDSTPVTSVNASGTYGEAWKDLGQVIQWWWEGTLLKKLFQTQERRFRRLVTVLATFTSMAEANEDGAPEATLEQVPCI